MFFSLQIALSLLNHSNCQKDKNPVRPLKDLSSSVSILDVYNKDNMLASIIIQQNRTRGNCEYLRLLALRPIIFNFWCTSLPVTSS